MDGWEEIEQPDGFEGSGGGDAEPESSGEAGTVPGSDEPGNGSGEAAQAEPELGEQEAGEVDSSETGAEDDDGGREESGGNSDGGPNLRADDTGTSSADGSSSGEGETGSVSSPGDQGEQVEDEGADQPENGTYEGVTAEDFSVYAAAVDSHFAQLDALLVVLIVAVFLSAGIAAADVLVRRMFG